MNALKSVARTQRVKRLCSVEQTHVLRSQTVMKTDPGYYQPYCDTGIFLKFRGVDFHNQLTV